ncbi:motility protein A [Lacticigenium naphthae]|uniref:motility protein A n=1 Tax=Lacticigenium naphthae TaxID=515351 RepID=UPI0004258F2F|nr:motility protein A [Lacticigenium naphthae]
MKRNIFPLIGLVVGIGLILWSMSSSGPLIGFFDGPSLIIVVAGSFSALLISFPFTVLKKVPSLLKKMFFAPNDDRRELIDLITGISKKMRREGALAIEDDIASLTNPLLIYGLQMVVDGVDGETIEELMELEYEQITSRHSVGQMVFLKWGEYAPAFGMIGTLIGLIAMLSDLADPTKIGTGMATALLTTFYGSFLANMVFLPIAKNLEEQSREEMKTFDLIMEGVMSLQKGQNPRVIEQKLVSFLSTSEKGLDEEASVRNPAVNEG